MAGQPLRREEVIRKLQRHRARYAAFDVKSLALFGSVARNEADVASDAAVIVEFNGPATYDNYITRHKIPELRRIEKILK